MSQGEECAPGAQKEVAHVRASKAPEMARSRQTGNRQWFGASVALATGNKALLPHSPFPERLREVMKPHIAKASGRRQTALDAIRKATGATQYDVTLAAFQSGAARETDFEFDSNAHPLRETLLETCGMARDLDLEFLHKDADAKETMLRALSSAGSPSKFQLVYDAFVREVCAPKLASMYAGDLSTIFYQAFPCLRVIKPDEFSIGPHADVAYGHHPCSVNFYVPLTKIEGTSSLYLESAPGLEDWHPIVGNYGRVVKCFPGAINLHWTTDNKTDRTRVSLDLRLIPGPMFEALECGGSAGGQRDVYRGSPGYYSMCVREDGRWVRRGPLQHPDARVGFPWTVKDWSKVKRRRPRK